jgi:hypothetical protein
MEIPDPSKWMTLNEAASKLGTTYKVMWRLWKYGRLVNGRRVHLKTWMTIKGRVTTLDEMKFVHQELNF